MKTKPKTTGSWYNQQEKAIALTLISLLGAYIVGSWALNTGSLQQYAIALFLIIFAIVNVGKRANAKGAKSESTNH